MSMIDITYRRNSLTGNAISPSQRHSPHIAAFGTPHPTTTPLGRSTGPSLTP